MPSLLDQVFELLPEAVDGYIDQDRAKKRVRVRADDGRTVTLYFRPPVIAAAMKAPGHLAWFGDKAWSPLRRWVALLSVHIDESINALNKATEYVQHEGGFRPIGDPAEDESLTDFDSTGAYLLLGGQVSDTDHGATDR
jgi:hypothetical protein